MPLKLGLVRDVLSHDVSASAVTHSAIAAIPHSDAAQACPGAAQVCGGAAALEPARGGEPGAHGGHVQQPRVLLQAHREAPRRHIVSTRLETPLIYVHIIKNTPDIHAHHQKHADISAHP